MKLISHNDILNAKIDPKQCYTWVEDLLRRKKDIILPPKTALHLTDEMYYNVMPSVFMSEGFAGVKVIQRHPEAVPALSSQLMLHDLKTGELKAVMDASWITAMRTGAVAVHVIKKLAVPDFEEIGIMGLGNTGRAAMSVLLAMYPERRLKVKVLRYKNQAEEFIAKYESENPQVQFVIVDSADEIVSNSDIVISAITFTGEQIADVSLFKPGCLVIPIHLRGFMDCDTEFDKVFCDDYAHVKGFKHFSEFKYLAEMAEVESGEKVGRESNDERIIAYNVGLSMHDVNFAERIYEVIESRIEAEYNLNPPAEKYYI